MTCELRVVYYVYTTHKEIYFIKYWYKSFGKDYVMSKQEIEFTSHKIFEIDGFKNIKGVSENMVKEYPKIGVFTRILQIHPNTDTTSNRIKMYNFWNKIIVTEGSIIDLRLNEEYTVGMVATYPPGKQHGPWKSPNGCEILEVRYYDH